jgi:hypothetical protein
MGYDGRCPYKASAPCRRLPCPPWPGSPPPVTSSARGRRSTSSGGSPSPSGLSPPSILLGPTVKTAPRTKASFSELMASTSTSYLTGGTTKRLQRWPSQFPHRRRHGAIRGVRQASSPPVQRAPPPLASGQAQIGARDGGEARRSARGRAGRRAGERCGRAREGEAGRRTRKSRVTYWRAEKESLPPSPSSPWGKYSGGDRFCLQTIVAVRCMVRGG